MRFGLGLNPHAGVDLASNRVVGITTLLIEVRPPSTPLTARPPDGWRTDNRRRIGLLEVKDLVLRFGGVTALDHISFTVADDEICGLIGPNGAGKTSLFNCVTRVYRPDAGLDRLRRHRPAGVAPPPDRAKGVARTFQNLALFPSHDRAGERHGGRTSTRTPRAC